MAEKAPHSCSFCDKTQDQVALLIAGPTCFICDECVESCVGIIMQKGRKASNKLTEIKSLTKDET